MSKNAFADVAAVPGCAQWEALIRRETGLYHRDDEVRSEFARDYTRLLHSLAYRRLKHKTQVFYNIDNDHVCTRMEHVAHVESVSGTIAKFLGLNTELTKAIATGHDVGHAPFGHQGERILNELSQKYLGTAFWHERNGLRFVDKIDLLANSYNDKKNLDLTYAVRDGIISHCGEVDENGLFPRKEMIDLEREFTAPGMFQPATWEGCLVKIADKVAYIGRDIEDAKRLGFLNGEAEERLQDMARIDNERVLNTTVIMHNMIIDICENSTPERGICLSERFFGQMTELKKFNYEYIYRHKRFRTYSKYSAMVIHELFDALYEQFDGKATWMKLEKEAKYCPELFRNFRKYLSNYVNPDQVPEEFSREVFRYRNEKVYGDLDTSEQYVQAIIDFISGMTDRYAIAAFEELLKY